MFLLLLVLLHCDKQIHLGEGIARAAAFGQVTGQGVTIERAGPSVLRGFGVGCVGG